MTLQVIKAALMQTVQDLGRWGYQQFGLPESGPIDWWAFRVANGLVDNPPGSACIEMGFSDASLAVEAEALLAVCGAGFELFVNQHQLPLWMSFRVRRGDQIRLVKCSGGSWIYLAAKGGLSSPAWLGSRSVYPRAGLGRQMVAGDRISLQLLPRSSSISAGRMLAPSARPAYDRHPVIDVIAGPHLESFQPEAWDIFQTAEFDVTLQSDRMGFRLAGPVLRHRTKADLVSQGIPAGAVQVPADGQPIVMMPDHPTTGGYTCIAAVTRVGMPLLAQCQPGLSEVRFRAISVDSAQAALQQALQKMTVQTDREEDLWLQL
jgi:antagonist of KipI